jgi:DNA processing protein
VTSVQLYPGALPQRLEALGWRRPVYLRGQLSEGSAVAIVGARAATALGMARAHALGRHLAGTGVHVVSGGALGIDGAAHRGALAAGGTTTAVLGSGLDIAYPARHAPLFDQILARGGALAGLLPDGTQPRRGTFVARNPLIAALADVVIVVEAELGSGSLSTAAAGARFGRVVAAWPGSPGCDRLLARGAAVVESSDDVDRARRGEPRFVPPVVLDPAADQVARALRAGACGIDQIVRHTGLPVRDVLRVLPTLERLQ